MRSAGVCVRGGRGGRGGGLTVSWQRVSYDRGMESSWFWSVRQRQVQDWRVSRGEGALPFRTAEKMRAMRERMVERVVEARIRRFAGSCDVHNHQRHGLVERRSNE